MKERSAGRPRAPAGATLLRTCSSGFARQDTWPVAIVGLGRWIIMRVEELLRSSPAGERLKWLLDGLDGQWPADVDAELVLSPTFIAQVSPARFVSVMSERAKTLAPIRIVGLDVEPGEGAARFRSAAGDLWVAKVSTEGSRHIELSAAMRIPSSPTT